MNNPQNNEATFYTIDIEAKRIKGVTDDGRKYDFITYEGVNKRGELVKFKFRKELSDQIPNREGDFVLVVDKRYIARDKKSKYEVYWVRKIESFEEKIFEEVENTEDLPF